MLCQLIISIQQLLQMTVDQDLNNISAAVDVASLTLAGLYRQAFFTLYIDDFKRIVEKVDANFKPDRMPNRVDFDMRRWLKRSKLYTYIYLVCPIVIIIVWVTSRNIDNIKIAESLEPEGDALNVTSNYQEIADSRDKYVKRRLPVNCWYPFDSGVSPAFEIAFVWETSMSMYSGQAYVMSDLFLFMVIYLICGQLEILKRSLRLLRKDYDAYKLKTKYIRSIADVSQMDKAKFEEIDRDVIKCVEYHCEITELIGELDGMLRTMIVVDFLHAVISLSFAMLQTIIAKSFYEWLQMATFIGVCVLHQFLNNLFAEVLIQQQEAVDAAVYEAPWVEGSDTLRAAVYMTTAQARSPTKLSGWQMYVLGNSTFVDFMKLLSSYFLVLQSLHAKEIEEQAK